MHQSILTPLHVMADKTVITTIQCTMIFGQHVLFQSISGVLGGIWFFLRGCIRVDYPPTKQYAPNHLTTELASTNSHA